MILTSFPDMLIIADIAQGFLFFSQFFNVFNPFSPAVRFIEVFKQKKREKPRGKPSAECLCGVENKFIYNVLEL